MYFFVLVMAAPQKHDARGEFRAPQRNFTVTWSARSFSNSVPGKRLQEINNNHIIATNPLLWFKRCLI